MNGVPMAPDVSAAAVAAKTPGYSGADMAAVCDRAKMAGVRRQITSGHDELVTGADFADALEKVKPSVSAEMIKNLERWRDAKEKPSGADEDDD
jgi:SpoVK/Ycf46/Vps4 family AAA+-type ATPase